MKTSAELSKIIFNQSETRKIAQCIDWSKHRLGPLENWPQTLKIAVSLILNSQFPMFVSWGEERVFLYNDAYAPILGEKHPLAFGQTFHENWNEIWDDILPLILKVEKGEAVYLEDLKLVMHRHRFGELEETYFTFSYSPIRDETGIVRGLHCACFETTARKKAEVELISSEKLKDQALKEVEAAKDRLHSSFMQTPAPVAVLSGPEHVYELANPPYEAMVNRSVVGKKVLEAFSHEEVGDFVKLLDDVYRTGVRYVGRELPLRLPDLEGEIHDRFIDVTYHARRDSQGKINGIIAVHQDVTEQVTARRVIEDSKHAIENERENFRNLFKQTPEMVCILRGPNHIFEFVNEAHAKVLGFDATGMAVREAQPESIEVHGILDDVYRTGKTAELHEIPVTVTDRLRFFNLTYAARRDDDGHVNGVMILGAEVTGEVLQREQLKENDELLKLALESAKMGAWTINLETNSVGMSEEALRLFGLDTISGNAESVIQSVIHPEDRNLAQSDLNNAIAGILPYESEYRIIRVSDRAIRWIYATGRARFNKSQKPVAYSGIVMDITERKLSAERIAHAKLAAEEASVAKSRFLANMSHEIRTPLGVMMGFAELALDQPTVSEEVADYLKAIKRNGVLPTRIIGEVLDLAKIEASKIEIENVRFHLPSLIDEVISFLKVQAQDRGISLLVELNRSVPELISSDSTRLRQILINLVGNAVKFTEKGSVKLYVNLKSSSGTSAELEFIVCDTGIGLTAVQKEKLFQPFTQADSSMTRKYGGTGLGLALSKQLAQAMGGDVLLQESAEAVGSIFVCTLKAEVIEQRHSVFPIEDVHLPAAKASRTQVDLEGVCVLLVEDSADNQVLFGRYLKSAGAKVALADNGQEGIEKALSDRFDLVLMDIQMPIKNGHQATSELRQRGYKQPIVALTAHAMKEERDLAMSEGFSDYLTKPLSRQTLVETIKRLAR